jgi:hypothetical protein
MLHAYLYTICFVFCYTSWCFYAFSRTNLLTRCHSASSLFSAVFVFQKSYTGNILGIGRNKSQSSYFSWSVTESKAETEGRHEAAMPPHGAGYPQVVPGTGVGPWSTSRRRPFAYIFPSTGKPKRTRSIFLETYCKPPSSSTLDWVGPEALPGTLSERGITAGGLLHHHACPGVARWLSSPPCASCLDLVRCLSWSRSSLCNSTCCVCWDSMNIDTWWLVDYTPLGTPRGRDDEHNIKSSLSCETKVYRTSRRKPNFRRWCLLASRQLRTIYKAPRLGLCFAAAATWNLHTTQPRTLPQLTMRLSISSVCCK